MKIFLGSDHGGYDLKRVLEDFLKERNLEYVDCGTYDQNATDYPDFAAAVALQVRESMDHYGILICRSGEGMEIAANKFPGIRAALAWQADIVQSARQHNNANILVLPADFITVDLAQELVDLFLKTDFSNEERHVRRLEKIEQLEKTAAKLLKS